MSKEKVRIRLKAFEHKSLDNACAKIVEIVKKAKFEMSNVNTNSDWDETVNENAQTKIVEIIIIGTKILLIEISHFKSFDMIIKLSKIIKMDQRWNLEQ